jgi:hypothetical protein
LQQFVDRFVQFELADVPQQRSRLRACDERV